MNQFKAMKETLPIKCCLLATLLFAFIPSKQCGAVQDPPTTSQAGEWINLFDGQTLSNWVQRGGKARFRVEDDCIVASTIRGEPDSFLCTEREFGDFELQLEFQVMAEDSRINSGVQFRSQSLAAFKNGIVHGYQIEIDPSDRAWTGGIYDQNRRGWLFQPEELLEAKRAFKLGQWNTLRLVCQKDSIKTWVNQVPVSDIRDDQTLKGFIAFQITPLKSLESCRFDGAISVFESYFLRRLKSDRLAGQFPSNSASISFSSLSKTELKVPYESTQRSWEWNY